MSIYRKFIESAAVECDQLIAPAEHQFSVVKQQQQQQQLDNQEAHKTTMLGRQKSRAHMATASRLSPLASVVGSTLSSTPITSKHQYKRLVEASDLYKNVENYYDSGNHHHHHQHQHQHQLQPNNQQNLYAQQHQARQQQQQQQQQCHNSQSSCNIYCNRTVTVGPPSQTSHQAQRCLSLADIQRQSSGSHQRLATTSIYEQQQNQKQPSQRNVKSKVSFHRHQQLKTPINRSSSGSGIFRTDDPVLLEWLRAMRFETELECLTALQARTLAIDENSAIALSVRNSQVVIQEMRFESDMILNLIDCLIDSLPVNFNTIDKFAMDFSELYVKLTEQTRANNSAQQRVTTTATSNNNKQQQLSGTLTNAAKNYNYIYCNQPNNYNNLTIINCTPRKSLASARTLRPLDKLAVQIREICIEMANLIQVYQDNYNSFEHIDNGNFEAMLRKIKELLGKFVEISIRAECANIVRALDHDFGGSSSSSLVRSKCSTASLRPVRPYESSTAQLPLKWALIALWQLTKDDGYICRTLTEKWQTGCGAEVADNAAAHSTTPSKIALATCEGNAQKPRSARRLDYSTKYDQDENNNYDNENKCTQLAQSNQQVHNSDHSLRSDYEKLYAICQNNEQFREKQHQLMMQNNAKQQQQQQRPAQGALSSALKSKQQQPAIKHVSTIELLIDIIISQPNRHERIDMINFLHENKLVDVEQDLDQSISAAFYTSNQYKVAALRILNHLCINEQAVKTILKCFSTPPPKQGQPIPANKIIKSIFECYQTAQEHIYQNETMFNPSRTPRKARKRARRQEHDMIDCEEFSDYGSRQTTNSVPTSSELCAGACNGGSLETESDSGDDEGDDAVVKEAIRLLVQLTTPFYKSSQGHDYYTLIGRFSIEALVKYLTNIIKSTTNREMLLLSLSALANISFITTEPMKQFGTNRIILEMFRASKSRSKDLELRDQTVTILANTADKNLLDIVSNGGLMFLLSSLEICPTRMSNYKMLKERLKHDIEVEPYSSVDESDAYGEGGDRGAGGASRRMYLDNRPRGRKPIDLSDEFLDDLDCACDSQQTLTAVQLTCLSRLTVNEMAALERIHQKTAVAFARMSSDPSTTRMVLKYGGIKQMIDLCKLSHKRNHSDTVLIACLAALKKISKVIGRDTFRHYNALDLIDLEPERALEIYGRLYASEV